MTLDLDAQRLVMETHAGQVATVRLADDALAPIRTATTAFAESLAGLLGLCWASEGAATTIVQGPLASELLGPERPPPEADRAADLLSQGQYAEALEVSRRVMDAPQTAHPGALADLVEAAARTGEWGIAQRATHGLVARAGPANPAEQGLVARSRALLAGDDAAEALFREAIDLLWEPGFALERARAHLLFGEWLRRRRRRTDARQELRTALAMFLANRDLGFAERTRIELAATTEHARRREEWLGQELTAQEHQVATLAADGASNPQIATKLYISTNTVEYHMKKVFDKLDLTSRAQLGRALARMDAGAERLEVAAG